MGGSSKKGKGSKKREEVHTDEKYPNSSKESSISWTTSSNKNETLNINLSSSSKKEAEKDDTMDMSCSEPLKIDVSFSIPEKDLEKEDDMMEIEYGTSFQDLSTEEVEYSFNDRLAYVSRNSHLM